MKLGTIPLVRLAAVGAALHLTAAAAPANGRPEYNRDVRPILAENCFACHGPDSASRKAGLRLDVREEAVSAGAIVPGKPEGSKLVERILSKNAAKQMPPPKVHKKLTATQKETLQRWIADGAEYQPHWSFLAAKRPELPTVKDRKWARNPIDHFILAELEKRGLKPAAEADRRTLARRLSLDLIGLPPDPKEVEAFVNDRHPNAYERYVDSLLASPHWGEHRGRYWLDAARYADTHGIHFDNYREIWSYRDWVINAFNKNQRFDRFTVEQLAGDLLPNRTLDQQVATGFNRCNITTNEGGVIAEEYLVLYTRDRTETAAQVWLGLTAGCAVCHDHKFDPLSMREFYSLAAFFNNTTQGAMDGNVPNTPPVVVVPRGEDRPRWNVLSKEIEKLRNAVNARKQEAKKDFDAWLAKVRPADLAGLVPTDGLRLHARLDDAQSHKIRVVVDGKPRAVSVPSGTAWVAGTVAPKALAVREGESLTVPDAGDFDRGQPFAVGAWVKIARRGTTGALVARMDNGNAHRGWDLWIENDRVGTHIIHKWPDDALKVTARTPLQPNKWAHVLMTYDGSGKAGGVRVYVNGTLQPVDVFTDKLQNTTRTNVPLKLGQRHTSERVKDAALQDVRLYGRALSLSEAEQLAKAPRALELVRRGVGKIKPKEREELFDWWLAALDQPSRELNVGVGKLAQEEVQIRSRGTIAHVMQERDGEAHAYMLHRGEYDRRRDKVLAATPKALPPMPADLPRNRLGFAQWLLRPENPLTARVTVNRFWQEVFGNGLVRTSGDFGVTGDLPSHPELLDWLATEFQRDWDVKRFFKLIVTSAAYRQSAAVSEQALAKDPHNRLLSRGARFRMDAEMLRDYALAASGLMSRKLGGPSVKPYMPEGVWEAVAMIGSNTRDYRRDSGESLYRRSMYTFWKRAAPPAAMDVLNAPNRETCTVRRERTNTPLQALVTLNDPQLVEAARHLAEKALKHSPTAEGRIDFLARRLLARPFTAEELPVVRESLAELLAHYRGNEADARKLIAVGESRADPSLDPAALAAWTMLSNQLLNLDEVLNK